MCGAWRGQVGCEASLGGVKESPMTFQQAFEIVEEWLREANEADTCGPRAILTTATARYGWVFWVQDVRYVRTLDFRFKRMGGRHGLVVTKVDGGLHLLPTGVRYRTYADAQ